MPNFRHDRRSRSLISSLLSIQEFAPVVNDGLLRESTGCGVAIGVVDHGQRRVFTYGAARADSIFEIGSVTKTLTGLALAQLAVQKIVTLDEPLRPILFPDIAAGSAALEESDNDF